MASTASRESPKQPAISPMAFSASWVTGAVSHCAIFRRRTGFRLRNAAGPLLLGTAAGNRSSDLVGWSKLLIRPCGRIVILLLDVRTPHSALVPGIVIRLGLDGRTLIGPAGRYRHPTRPSHFRQSDRPLIAPSVLARDFARLPRAAVGEGADWLHVDVHGRTFRADLTIGLPVVEILFAATDIPGGLPI